MEINTYTTRQQKMYKITYYFDGVEKYTNPEEFESFELAEIEANNYKRRQAGQKGVSRFKRLKKQEITWIIKKC